MNELDQPRSLSKFELYQNYYGLKATKKGVNRFFKREIYSHPKLMKKLHQTQFRKTQKILTETQVAIIYDHLTPPLKQIPK